ncbi:MAG TPA: acyltransferase family protein, partial [Gemmatimonadaceae bacterium]|nr:acyltransferase family protein [Gemmatimonadaceae bacterium]
LMTALALPVLRALRTWPTPLLRAEMRIARRPGLFLIVAGLVVLAGALVPYRWTERWPYEHLLNVKDLARYGAMFAVGISYGLLAAVRDALRDHRRANLGLWAVLTIATWALLESPPAPGSALAYGAVLVEAVCAWAWVAGIVGYARQYLTRLTPAVADLSEVSYAMYLTHPTLVVVTGFLVTPRDWSIGTKFVVSSVVVFVATYLLCRVIRRYRVTRWLFGLRAAPTRAPERRTSSLSAVA